MDAKLALLVGIFLVLGTAAAACGESQEAGTCAGRSPILAGSIEVSQDQTERTLAELRCVQVVTGDLRISGVDSLAPLASLVHVQGDLLIAGNPDLTTLSGLDQLTRVDGDLDIRSNPALSSLDGLAALEQVGGSLDVAFLASLEELTGLESLERVGDDLSIMANAALTRLAALESLGTVGGNFQLIDNESLASADLGRDWSEGPVIAGTITVLHNDNLEELVHFGALASQAPGCSLGHEDLWVASNPQLRSITLPSLGIRRACINIFNDAQLTSITASDVWNLSRLDLMDLPSLSTVDLHAAAIDTLQITTTGLTTLQGLGRVTCGLSVSDNPALTDLGDLASHPGQVADFLLIRDNPRLPQCAVDAMLKSLGETNVVCTNAVTPTAPIKRTVDGANNDVEAVCE
jgi:hypothetical protein